MNFSIPALRLIIIIAGIVLFVPFLGAVHLFDWDEINFAECAREMIVTGNYSTVTINYQPFWEKPPLFFWMQALSMNVFGVNEFAARLPNAICGIITLLFLFNAGCRIYDKRLGILWTLAFAGSFLPHFYFKSGIIDPWFNLFIFSSLYYFILYTSKTLIKQNRIKLIFSAVLLGLAIMTKGPVALLLIGLCISIFWVFNHFKPIIKLTDLFLFGFITALTGSFWFISEIIRGNEYIIKDFIEYQVRLFETKDAGHGGPFFYHLIVLLIGCFPVSLFAIKGFKKWPSDDQNQSCFRKWMIILFWVVLIIFSIVKTKIIHYSSLCYFPLTFLAAYAVYKSALAKGLVHRSKLLSTSLLTIGILISILLIVLPFIEKFKKEIIAADIIKDKFAVANLEASPNWHGFEFLTGIIFLTGVIVAYKLLRKGKMETGFIAISLATLLTTNITAILYVPKIEEYSQGASIEFYKSLIGKDVYVETLGFKSYAYLFYSDKQPQKNTENFNKEWLLTGPVDKPAYFVSKITEAEKNKVNYPQLKELYRKNGFVFYERTIVLP